MDAVVKLKELYETRDKADQQIQAIERLLGADPLQRKERKPQTCSKCGSENHSARTCPTKLTVVPQTQL